MRGSFRHYKSMTEKYREERGSLSLKLHLAKNRECQTIACAQHLVDREYRSPNVSFYDTNAWAFNYRLP